MPTPAVLVGMSVYQQQLSWLAEAVASVQSQTFHDWQLIVRADGPDSVDAEAHAWLEDLSLSDSRIIFVVGEKRLGTFGSYKQIFFDSNADYIAQLDADDRLREDALQLSVNAMHNNPQFPFTYSQARLIGPTGVSGPLEPRSLRPWQPNLDLVQFLCFHLRVVRTQAYKAVGGYDSSFQFSGDYDLSLKLSEIGCPCYVPEPLYQYRLHSTSTSQKRRVQTHLEASHASRAAIKRRGLAAQWRLIQSPISQFFSLEQRKPAPFAVVGLHRCGTSLLSRLLQSLGFQFGEDTIKADQNQPDGYLEDKSLVALHRHWFRDVFSPTSAGWPDWGWSSSGNVSSLGKRHWKPQAQAWAEQNQKAFLASITSKNPNPESLPGWAFKDPRLTILLPFWQDCLPSLKFLAVYRTPWDFADALQRLSHPQFRTNPELILPLWSFYNQRLVEFVESRCDSIILLHAETLASDPSQLPAVLGQRWDLFPEPSYDAAGLQSLVDPGRLHHLPLDDPLAHLYAHVYPQHCSLFLHLQANADLPCPEVISRSGIPLDPPPEQPTLTVVIPSYNPCHWLLEAIASVERCKGLLPVEILIVDDGSTRSESVALLQSLETAGYRVIRQANSGLSSARNLGFQEARSTIILPLDDDNRLLEPYFVEGVRLMLSRPELSFVYGDRVDFGARSQLFRPGPISRQSLARVNTVDACALVRKSLWERVGGYDESMTALEDWDFWLSAVSMSSQAAYIQQPCFEYRVRENSMLHRHLARHDQHLATVQYLSRKHSCSIGTLTPT